MTASGFIRADAGLDTPEGTGGLGSRGARTPPTDTASTGRSAPADGSDS